MGRSCPDNVSQEVNEQLDLADEKMCQSCRDWEEYAREMPAIEKALAEKEAIINEKIDSVAKYIDGGLESIRAKNIMLIHDSPSNVPEPSPEKIEAFMQRVLFADTKTVIIPLGNERNLPPFFIQEFRNSGQEFQLEIEGKVNPILIQVYTPILPTIENLSRMIKGNNPITPWGEEIEFHHVQQKAEGPLMVLWQGYHKRIPTERGEKAMPEPDRKHWKEVQRKAICEEIARLYLGNWANAFEQAKK